MAADVIQFVDSIADNPAVRLDLNDETTWRCRSFLAPPPRLRRTMTQNTMTDGGYVSSSQYGTRTLYIDLDLISSSQDVNAGLLQKLAREMDREKNLIRYQPEGASRPVFFKVWRSDFSALVDMKAALAFRQLALEIPAEPFALGGRETISVGTVNNDPAAGSNGCYFDVTGVIGDVAAPAVILNTAGVPYGFTLAARQHGTPSDLVVFKQAESLTNGTDTANPGGGPDAAMSGTGTNNYLRTSFVTTTMSDRVTGWAPTDADTSDAAGRAIRGTYRVLAAVRRTDSTSDITIRWARQFTSDTGDTITVPKHTRRQLVDLGLITFGGDLPASPGGVAVVDTPVRINNSLKFQAARSSGTGNIDWDVFFLAPADESTTIWLTSTDSSLTGFDHVIDGVNQRTYMIEDGGNLFDGTGYVYQGAGQGNPTGGFPQLVPNQTNRFYLHLTSASAGSVWVYDKTYTASITVYYNPRYLHVRPASS